MYCPGIGCVIDVPPVLNTLFLFLVRTGFQVVGRRPTPSLHFLDLPNNYSSPTLDAVYDVPQPMSGDAALLCRAIDNIHSFPVLRPNTLLFDIDPSAGSADVSLVVVKAQDLADSEARYISPMFLQHPLCRVVALPHARQRPRPLFPEPCGTERSLIASSE